MKNFTHFAPRSFLLFLTLWTTHSCLGQAHSSEFELPAGWQETENWMWPYQQVFGPETSQSPFVSLLSASDFLLTHPDHAAFIFVWKTDPSCGQSECQSVPPAHTVSEQNVGYRIERFYPPAAALGWRSENRIMAKEIIMTVPNEIYSLHILLIAPQHPGLTLAIRDIPEQLGGSWYRNRPHPQEVVPNQVIGFK